MDYNDYIKRRNKNDSTETLDERLKKNKKRVKRSGAFDSMEGPKYRNSAIIKRMKNGTS